MLTLCLPVVGSACCSNAAMVPIAQPGFGDTLRAMSDAPSGKVQRQADGAKQPQSSYETFWIAEMF